MSFFFLLKCLSFKPSKPGISFPFFYKSAENIRKLLPSGIHNLTWNIDCFVSDEKRYYLQKIVKISRWSFRFLFLNNKKTRWQKIGIFCCESKDRIRNRNSQRVNCSVRKQRYFLLLDFEVQRREKISNFSSQSLFFIYFIITEFFLKRI